jgi:hypothetical protein
MNFGLLFRKRPTPEVDLGAYCQSVANKVGMIYGDLTFKNVVALLTSTGLNATPHPTGISIERFAAMVIQSTKGDYDDAQACEGD